MKRLLPSERALDDDDDILGGGLFTSSVLLPNSKDVLSLNDAYRALVPCGVQYKIELRMLVEV